MAYKLIDLNYSSKPKDCCYFFDSNILLPVLGLPPRKGTAKYLSFFQAVYNHTQAVDLCKIYTCSNQLSEVFNVLMHIELKKRYGPDQQVAYPNIKDFYKRVFRQSGEYKKAFTLYKDEFETYINAFELSTPNEKVTIKDTLDFDAQKLDLNDQIILQVVQNTGAILVSDDGDFYGEDLTQATFNTTLIKKSRDNIRPATKEI